MRASSPERPRKVLSIWGFGLRFLAYYCLLVAPWPGWNSVYGAWVRVLGRAAYTHDRGRWHAEFEPLARTPERPLDTRIALIDREAPTIDGRFPAAFLDIDTRGIGWVPTALFAALALAMPLPYRRRGRALLLGLVAMHAWLLVEIGVHLADHADAIPGEGPDGLSRLLKATLDGLDETLIVQLGASFVAPVVLWAMIMLNSRDLRTLSHETSPRPPASQPATKPLRHGDIRVTGDKLN